MDRTCEDVLMMMYVARRRDAAAAVADSVDRCWRRAHYRHSHHSDRAVQAQVLLLHVFRL